MEMPSWSTPARYQNRVSWNRRSRNVSFAQVSGYV